jgi:predicted peptidase
MKLFRMSVLAVALIASVNFQSAIGAEEAATPPILGAPHTPGFGTEYKRCVFPSEAKSGEDHLDYNWLTPLEQKPGEKYPMVICLHGRGGSVGCSRLLVQPEMREKFPTFVMVPEAPRPAIWAKPDIILKEGAPTPIDGPEKYPILMAAIRSVLKTEAVDPSRVYITGQSMGGIGTWGAIARNPELFAAAVPVCGAWSLEDAPKMVKVPIWAFHGEQDPTVPVHWSRDLVEAVKKAGGTARYTEYPGIGHDSWTQAYQEAEMWQWLFAQKK